MEGLNKGEVVEILGGENWKGVAVNGNPYIQWMSNPNFFTIFSTNKENLKNMSFSLYKDDNRGWVATLFKNNNIDEFYDNVKVKYDSYEDYNNNKSEDNKSEDNKSEDNKSEDNKSELGEYINILSNEEGKKLIESYEDIINSLSEKSGDERLGRMIRDVVKEINKRNNLDIRSKKDKEIINRN